MTTPALIFSPGFFGRLFAKTPPWTIVLSCAPSAVFDGKPRISTLAELAGASILEGYIWCDLHVGGWRFAGLTKGQGRSLIASAKRIQKLALNRALEQQRHAELEAKKIAEEAARLMAEFDRLSEPLTNTVAALDALLKTPFYVRETVRVRFLAERASEFAILRELEALLAHPFFAVPAYAETRKRLTDLWQYCDPPYAGFQARNKRFVREEKRQWADFFKKVEKSELTDEQQIAVIVHEDRNRLIAAAGSGKSSTLVAKVGYALRKGYVKQNEVLALAFNNDAAKELSERLINRLGLPIKAQTFHSLGLEILQKTLGGKTLVHGSDIALGNQLEALLREDTAYRERFCLHQAVHQQTEPEKEFNSVEEYEAYIRQVGKRNKETDTWGIPTLRGEYVRSFEELAIANWLHVNGIQYRYESPYPHDVAELGWKKYEPDFCYPLPDGSMLYHEHFALRENGTSPFGDGYVWGVTQKRMLHEKHETSLIETSSADFCRGNVFDRLEAQLRGHGVHFVRMTLDAIERTLQVKTHGDFIKLISTLIAHAKESGLDERSLRTRATRILNQARTQSFLSLLFPLWGRYEKYLESTSQIDFADMIGQATSIVRGGAYASPYKLILVDEFQDISRGRANLVIALLALHSDSVLFGVGDDWQAINRFAGSDLSIMRNFETEFGKTETNYLRKTFRSNRGISSVAATFVSENRQQIRKDVEAVSEKWEGVVRIVEFSDWDDQRAKIVTKLNLLSARAAEEGRVISVMLLGRYKYKTTDAISDKQVMEWNRIYAGRLVIVRKEKERHGKKSQEALDSVHSSKGLEADVVIVHSVQARYYGFPSEMEDDVLLSLVLADRETHPFAEDRRLFYVALTRAKEEVTLYVSQDQPSTFVIELLEKNKYGDAILFEGVVQRPEPCTKCRQGYMVLTLGKFGPFVGCSAFRSNGCNEKRSVALTRSRQPQTSRLGVRLVDG